MTVSFTYRAGDTPLPITMKGAQKGDSMFGHRDLRRRRRASGAAAGQPRTAVRQRGTPTGALDISGAWQFEVNSPAGTGTPTMTFNQSGEKLTGQYVGQLGEAPIQGTLKGSELTFSLDVSFQDTKFHIVYTGNGNQGCPEGHGELRRPRRRDLHRPAEVTAAVERRWRKSVESENAIPRKPCGVKG